MSQHRILTNFQGKPLELILGWDRPLQRFFMSVLPSESEDDDEENASQAETPFDIAVAEVEDYSLFGLNANPTVSAFQEVLARLAIAVPPEVFIEVQKDGDGNVGNRLVRYGYAE